MTYLLCRFLRILNFFSAAPAKTLGHGDTLGLPVAAEGKAVYKRKATPLPGGVPRCGGEAAGNPSQVCHE